MTLMLWAVRHLWVYLTAINFKKGFLFPDLWKRREFSGVYTIPTDYDAFQSTFVLSCTTLFKRDGPFGTHTCRKTDAKEDELMTSARHKSLKTSIKYRKDANLMKHLAKKHNYVTFYASMPKWKPIYLESIQLARQITNSDVPETLKFNSIEQYVQYFTEKLLKLRSDSPNYSLTTLMERAIDFKRKLATSEALDSLLDSSGDSDLAVQIG